MQIHNKEFKASVLHPEHLEEKLLALQPDFIGTDHQTDTYFNVPEGRLKLREGNIENALIFYKRVNTASVKSSEILLYTFEPDTSLKNILIQTHGIKVIVDKIRKIYFIENVKFHFDRVQELGNFVEVEAIQVNESHNAELLKAQCDFYAHFFGLQQEDFIPDSYSDLLLNKRIKE